MCNDRYKYELLVEEGSYVHDSLIALIFSVFKHRCQHFLKGEGWRD